MTFAPEIVSPDTWPALVKMLKPAIDHAADATVNELIDDLLTGNAQLWVNRAEGGDPIAVAVSELTMTPRGKIVHGRLVAGKGLWHWVDDLIACISEHACQIGAVGIEISGRGGWERVLSARGWKRRAVVMEVALSPQMAGASDV